jgi:hypothetical protein
VTAGARVAGYLFMRFCLLSIAIITCVISYEEESKSNLNIFLLTEYVQIGLKTLRHFST